MELRFKGQFLKDLDLADRKLAGQVKDVIAQIEAASTWDTIHGIKKLRSYRTLFRIKVAQQYRIGLIIRKNIVWLVRFGHRSSFYNKFP